MIYLQDKNNNAIKELEFFKVQKEISNSQMWGESSCVNNFKSEKLEKKILTSKW